MTEDFTAHWELAYQNEAAEAARERRRREALEGELLEARREAALWERRAHTLKIEHLAMKGDLNAALGKTNALLRERTTWREERSRLFAGILRILPLAEMGATRQLEDLMIDEVKRLV